MTHIDELTDYLAGAGLLSPVETSTHSIVDVAGTLARWLGGESDSHVPGLSRRVSAARGIVFIVADGLCHRGRRARCDRMVDASAGAVSHTLRADLQ